MKNPKLAASLNLLPGLGYIYIDRRRLFGWLLVVSIALSMVAYLDPAFKEYLNAPFNWPYMIVGFIGLLACEVGFALDAYKEAKRHNSTISNEKTELPKERDWHPRGKTNLGIMLCIVLVWLYLQVIAVVLTYDYGSFGWSWLMTAADIITVVSAAVCIVLMHTRRLILISVYAVTYLLALGLYLTDQYLAFESIEVSWLQSTIIVLKLAIIAYLFKSKQVRKTLNR